MINMLQSLKILRNKCDSIMQTQLIIINAVRDIKLKCYTHTKLVGISKMRVLLFSLDLYNVFKKVKYSIL